MNIFTAKVITGSGRGKSLKVPTLNLDPAALSVTIKEGIYACYVQIGKKIYTGAFHYGPRPVFDDSTSCEVHLLDAEVTKAPEEVIVELVHRIRDVQNFPSVEALMQEIAEDITAARGILALSSTSL